MTLFLKNVIFTLVAPGTVAVYVPLWIGLHHGRATPWGIRQEVRSG